MRFARFGQWLVRRRVVLTVVAGFLFVAAGVIGSDVADSLSSGGFADPGAESTRAADVLEAEFDTGAPNLVLLVEPTGGNVDAPEVAEAGRALTDELAAEPGVSSVVSYWSLGAPPPLRADDGSSAIVLALVDGDQDQVNQRVEALSETYTRSDDTLTVTTGGVAEVFRQVGNTIEDDLALAELIAFPITLLLLVLVFRSLVAASLPLLIGGFSIVATFVVLETLAGFTQVSIFALNLTTAMGLGLAIDYSLFVVSRFREERATGYDTTAAVSRTVATAGRAVLFSGLTVAASLAALLVFPLAFLRSFAYAGIPVVLLAVIGAIVVLPALLALLGDRVDALSFGRRSDPGPSRFWGRLAGLAVRRPIGIATAAVVFLLVLGAPFLRVSFGSPDDRVLPESASSRQVSDTLRDDYSSEEAGALAVVLPGLDDDAALDIYAGRLSALDNVARVDAPTGIYVEGDRLPVDVPAGERFVGADGEWLSVVPAVEPISEDGEQLVADVRAVPAPAEALVGGRSAELVDTKASLFGRLPVALAIIGIVTFALLFLSFGSLLVPAKALVLNTLSLTATFGAMVWIFQDGNLSGFLDFTPTGLLDTTTPILMFCIAFGLSMDYEVFLLSRIKEDYDRTGDNRGAIVSGLARTGRIITAAAVLISVVMLAFATSSITFIKLFGIGLALAVIMDATVVRATLVPAFMQLAGRANWWAPASLRRLYDRVGMNEAAAEEALIDLREPLADESPAGVGSAT